jgi:hypothetical protein
VIRVGHKVLATKVEQIQTGVDRLVRASVDRIPPVSGMQEELEVLRHRLSQLEESLVELEAGPVSGRGRGGKRRGKRTARR